MDEAVPYRCINCGECCSRLLIDRQGVRKGLPLFPEERELFRKDYIKPGYGIGSSSRSRDFEVISYQMNKMVCPHRRLGGCAVWVYRPAVCRAYPFMPVITQGRKVQRMFDFACSALREHAGRHQNDQMRFQPETIDTEITHYQMISETTQKILKEPEKSWFYNLKNGRWVSLLKMIP